MRRLLDGESFEVGFATSIFALTAFYRTETCMLAYVPASSRPVAIVRAADGQ